MVDIVNIFVAAFVAAFELMAFWLALAVGLFFIGYGLVRNLRAKLTARRVDRQRRRRPVAGSNGRLGSGTDVSGSPQRRVVDPRDL